MAMRRIYEGGLGSVFLVENGEVYDLAGAPDGAGLAVLVRGVKPGPAMTAEEMADYAMVLDDSGALVSPDEDLGFRVWPVAQAEMRADEGFGAAAAEFWPEHMIAAAYLFGLDGTGRAWEAWLREPPDAERESYDRQQEDSETSRLYEMRIAARHNLDALTQAMQAQGLSFIDLQCDGQGDDGAVTAVRFSPGPCSAVVRGLQEVYWDDSQSEWTRRAGNDRLLDAVARKVVWDLLQARHPGWWNDGGGAATVRITTDGMEVNFMRRVEEEKVSQYREIPGPTPLPEPREESPGMEP